MKLAVVVELAFPEFEVAEIYFVLIKRSSQIGRLCKVGFFVGTVRNFLLVYSSRVHLPLGWNNIENGLQNGLQTGKEEFNSNNHHNQAHKLHHDFVPGFTEESDDFSGAKQYKEGNKQC